MSIAMRIQKMFMFVGLLIVGAMSALVEIRQEARAADKSPQCDWDLFDVRVDPPKISMSGKVDLLFRYSHPAEGSIFVDFGGAGGTRTQSFTGGCEQPAGFVAFTVEPSGVGEIAVELRDKTGTARAKTTTYVPLDPSQPLSITVKVPNQPSYKIDKITWSPNTTIALAMLRAKNLKKLDYTTVFYDQFGSMLETCQGFKPNGSEYWALYVDGQYSYFGMDSMVLSPGDQIELRVMDPASHNDTEKNTHQYRSITAAKKGQ
jgi:hypothetical protein